MTHVISAQSLAQLETFHTQLGRMVTGGGTLSDVQWANLHTIGDQIDTITAASPPPPPPPTPVPAPVPAPSASGLLWDGSKLSAYFHVGSGHAGAVTEVPAAGGLPGTMIQLEVHDSDRVDGNKNPSASALSPAILKPGMDVFIGTTHWIPSGFPLVGAGKWLQVREVYGPPWKGASPIDIHVRAVGGTNRYVFFNQDRLEAPNYVPRWTSPPFVYNAMQPRLVLHLGLETDNTGYVEIYYGGMVQTLLDGSTRINYATLDPTVDWDGSRGGNYSYIDCYHGAGQFPSPVIMGVYEHKIGTTLASVS